MKINFFFLFVSYSQHAPHIWKCRSTILLKYYWQLGARSSHKICCVRLFALEIMLKHKQRTYVLQMEYDYYRKKNSFYHSHSQSPHSLTFSLSLSNNKVYSFSQHFINSNDEERASMLASEWAGWRQHFGGSTSFPLLINFRWSHKKVPISNNTT